ncbi:MAG: glycerophosphodiester phosphodiesterase [Nostocales cyanobacterium]|nr:MAG: glycerophosphodiester phosphodiesterase [Nostocales cyanobacterium]TAF19835.1 MAG: glycerophosphodiester phosphodiesterase [Nostocales cyanobacterium]
MVHNVELIGFASLPADTFTPQPISGSGISANGRTGPFSGQPIQGFSGVQFAGDQSFYFLSDNGYGNKQNSADYLLRIYQVDPNFAGTENGDGSVNVLRHIQLSDPDHKIPFTIVNEGTSQRLLTGADLDVESIVVDKDGSFWIGDEFGPYLLHFDASGKLLEAPIETPGVRSPQKPFNTLTGEAPLVIGHRGASGDLPEHTLEAYALAIEQGANFVEPDLVITSDGVLIARHEPMLDDTTNVAEVFGENRKSTKMLDGVEVTAYFAEDFTLAEIKQLRAVQPRPYRDQSFNELYEIPTFQEVIELVQQVEAETGKKIGIYPETKHPTFFDEQGLSLEEPLIATLQTTGFTDPNRIFIQSFEFANLIDLQNNLLPAAGLEDIPLVQLYGDVEAANSDSGDGFSVPYDIIHNFTNPEFDETAARATYGDLVDIVANFGEDITGDGIPDTNYQDLATKEVFEYIGSAYAEGVGPWKNSFLLRENITTPVDGNGDGVAEIRTQLTGEIRPFIEWAHDAGMQVHPYTLRDEERFLTLNADGTPQSPEYEFRQLIELGVDGFFTDFPETGRMVLDEYLPNLPTSRGFEGMAYSPDRSTLYPLLEGTVAGDPENSLRIYEFDVATKEYQGLLGYYRTEVTGHAIGDFTPINNNEFLVIERDGLQGEAAEFKKIYKVDLSKKDANGFVEKVEIVDLLNIQDPNDLNGDGETTFTFPFVTIESVIVLDENTILVANDNNYPFSVGRGPDIDNNEIITLKLSQPLNLSSELGQPEKDLVTGTPDADILIGGIDFDAVSDIVFTGAGNDEVDVPSAGSRAGDNRVFTGSGADIIDVGNGDRTFGGSGDDEIDATDAMGYRLSGGAGNDTFHLGTDGRALGGEGNDKFFVQEGGNNIIAGGTGADQFWIVNGDLPMETNTIVDFTIDVDVLGIGGMGLNFEDLTLIGNTIMINSQTVAVLSGIDTSNLTADNFAFLP